MKAIDLSVGGESWSGWLFGPYGRSKEWRLLSPEGDSIQRSELSSMRFVALDNDHLKRTLDRLSFIMKPALAPDELQAIHAAILTLSRLMAGLSSEGRYPPKGTRSAHLPLDFFGYDQPGTG